MGGDLGPERGAAAGAMAQIFCVADGALLLSRQIDNLAVTSLQIPSVLVIGSWMQGGQPMKAGLWPMTAAPVGVVTLLKELPLLIARLLHYVLGETLDLVYPDRMMAAPSVSYTSLGASFLEHRLSGGGLLAVRCFIFVEDGESWRRGAAESRRWTRFDGRAQ